MPAFRIGIDENGLGAQLGPMIVTASLASVDEAGERFLTKRLPDALRRDLDDSKALVSCHNVSLGEAWTRAVVERTTGKRPRTPAALFRAISRESEKSLRSRCPEACQDQCWASNGEKFSASQEQLERVSAHLDLLASKGVEVHAVLSQVLCTARLNALNRRGIHRFTADLHAMEQLILDLRETTNQPVVAVCGKVGGIGKYSDYFGPLSGRLHSILEEGRASSIYHFPQLGELRFVRDADASDALVMLASLVGKYVRELLMRRVAHFYPESIAGHPPSGYHDPVSRRFVEASLERRQEVGIVDDCFLRDGKPKAEGKATKQPSAKKTPKKTATKKTSAKKTPASS